jgi:hypothetical protein
MLLIFLEWSLFLIYAFSLLLATIFYIRGLMQKAKNKQEKEKKSNLFKKANRFILVFIIALITYIVIQSLTIEVFPATTII